MPTRILLADDHPLFREGVASLLLSRGYEVVGQASDGLAALETARQLNPDLILMDINMPGLDGLAATRLICTELPGARVVMLTVSDDDENLFEAIKSGAQGYILKNTDTETFFDLLAGASQGEAPISRQLAGKILGEFARKMTGEPEEQKHEQALSERERQVLALVAQGLTNHDIAERLTLSENTIKYHLKNILQKLHLKNRAQAVGYAISSGLLKADTPLEPTPPPGVEPPPA